MTSPASQPPLVVGDRVCFSRGYCAAMFPIGRSIYNIGPICGGVEACDRGMIAALDESDFGKSLRLVEVEWDRGVRQVTPAGNLIRASLNSIMADNAHFEQTHHP